MRTFVKAVISGFGFTLGKALFDTLRNRFMPEEPKPADADVVDVDAVDADEIIDSPEPE